MSLSLSCPGGVLVWPGGTSQGSESSSAGGAENVAVGGMLVDWDVPSSAGGGSGVDSSVGGGGVAVGGSDVSPPGGG